MKGHSRHHVFYESPDYDTPALTRLRCHYGLIALIPNELHFEKYPESVHALIEPPTPPDYREVLGCLALLDSKRHGFLSHARQVIELTADYFGTHNNEPLGNNLYRQLDIFGNHIKGGR